MEDYKGYQPEGVKYTYPDDDPYQEGKEVYYNMAEFLNDDELTENVEYDMEHIDLSLEENAEWDNPEVMEEED